MIRVVLSLLLVFSLFSCIKERPQSCHDNMQNQNETDVDCGGVCRACPSCSDNILNQNETNIDCGGICDECANCEDGMKNQNETGIDCGDTCQACFTSACTLPLNYGSIGYLPTSNKLDTFNYFYGNVLDPDNETGVKFNLNFNFYPRTGNYHHCNGFSARFYGDAILNSSDNITQVFKTISPDVAGSANSCVVIIDMPGADFAIKPGERIYVTKLGENKYNIKFCDLPVPKTNDYNLNTSFSSNINFSFN